MNLFFLVFLLPAVASVKQKDEMRKCLTGMFINQGKRTKMPIAVEEGKVCVAVLSYSEKIMENALLADGTQGKRRICRSETLKGELRPAAERELIDRWQTATDPPEVDLQPGTIEFGHEIELEDDKEDRLAAEAAGNVTRRPPVVYVTEKPLIASHCRWLPMSKSSSTYTCFCYTDNCNAVDDVETFMSFIMAGCYAAKEKNETDEEYRKKCHDTEKDAISCLQRPLETIMSAKKRPPIDAVRKNSSIIQLFDNDTNGAEFTWNPESEYNETVNTYPPNAQTGSGANSGSAATHIVVTVSVVLVVLLLAGGLMAFVWIRRRRQKKELEDLEAGGDEEEGGDEGEEGEEGKEEQEEESSGGESTSTGQLTGGQTTGGQLDGVGITPSSETKPSSNEKQQKSNDKATGSDEPTVKEKKSNENQEEASADGVLKAIGQKMQSVGTGESPGGGLDSESDGGGGALGANEGGGGKQGKGGQKKTGKQKGKPGQTKTNAGKKNTKKGNTKKGKGKNTKKTGGKKGGKKSKKGKGSGKKRGGGGSKGRRRK